MSASESAQPPPNLLQYGAVLFDLDGVLTSTAKIHASCWKEMFDAYLRVRAQETGQRFTAFDIVHDYKQYVDGKPRYDGVRSFLASRGIRLSEGSPEGPPDWETVCGLGNHKNELVETMIRRSGVDVYPDALLLIRRLQEGGIPLAVVSSSKSCRTVLEAAQITDLFETIIDGTTAQRLQLPGKPAPDTFVKAAEMLGEPPSRAAVIEDAISGVRAGRSGGFGLVVGVCRAGDSAPLLQSGADVVVSDLAQLIPQH